MATTTDSQPQVRMIALAQIRHDANVRELAGEDVDALAGSIALLGQITPAIVRPDGEGYLLVAGHKRYAALQTLGHTEIRAEVRAGKGEHAERAAENVVRTQLNPYEPGGIALDASFGSPDDAITSGDGRSVLRRRG
jgi:ParB/RepB/Spo0J family partition protein